MLPLVSERSCRRRRRRMAGGSQRRKIMVVGLFLAMALGVAVYLRLWAIEYSLSSDDAERLRRQFDLANREAMDESAGWRRMYDEQAEKASKCEMELAQIKDSTGKGNTSKLNQNLESLQKENTRLLKEIETLKQELEASRLRCRS